MFWQRHPYVCSGIAHSVKMIMPEEPTYRHDASPGVSKPKHAQLRTYLAESILNGTLGGGEFLPSEPTLAREFLISRGTVRQALAELQNEGLIERIPGKGTVVARPLDEAVISTPQAPSALNLFAIVLPELGTGHYPALVQGFDESAGKVHHQTMVCATGNDLRCQGDIVLQLIDKKVAGVALAPPTAGEAPLHHIRQLHSHGIPLVILHRAIEGISVPVVALPYERIAELAARRLLECGHRRVAYIASHRGRASETYERSFRETIERGGGVLLDECIHYGTFNLGKSISYPNAQRTEEIAGALKRLLALPGDRRPTAIFDPWDSDAETIYLCAIREGLSVPQDMSIVGFGGAGRAGSLSASLTRVMVQEREVASLLVTLLTQMKNGQAPLVSNQYHEASVSFFEGCTLSSV